MRKMNTLRLSAVCKENRLNKVTDTALDEELRDLLMKLGIFPKLVGYDYLQTAIKLTVLDPDYAKHVTTRLYPAVGDLYSVGAHGVERAIRHAIENAVNRNKICNLNRLFGAEIYTADEKPTNAEFISLIAEKFSLRIRKAAMS